MARRLPTTLGAVPSDVTLPLSGGCGCGRVRFRVEAPPVSATYCHCTRCQRRTGTAASAQAYVEPGSVVIESGEEDLRSWAPADGMEKTFCGACGSSVFVRSPDDGAIVAVHLGAFDGDPGIRPSARQFVAYAAPWEEIPDDGLPRYPERRPS